MTDRFDLKLFLLRMIRKFPVLILGTVLGALIVGGWYLYSKLMLEPKLYSIRIVVHENLHYNDEYGQFTYINGYTWNEFVGMDVVAGTIAEDLGDPWTKEKIAPMLSAEVPSDTRVVYFYVTGEDLAEVSVVAQAAIPVLESVGEELPEIQDMLIMDVSEEPYEVNRIKYARNAFILGSLLGLAVAFFMLALVILADDSVYIPDLFTAQYGIPMEVFKGKVPEGALVIGRRLPDLTGVTGGKEVYIQSGAHNGTIVWKVLRDLKAKGMEPGRVYLTEAKEWMIKGYYAGDGFPNPFHRR